KTSPGSKRTKPKSRTPPPAQGARTAILRPSSDSSRAGYRILVRPALTSTTSTSASGPWSAEFADMAHLRGADLVAQPLVDGDHRLVAGVVAREGLRAPGGAGAVQRGGLGELGQAPAAMGAGGTGHGGAVPAGSVGV